LLKLCR